MRTLNILIKKIPLPFSELECPRQQLKEKIMEERERERGGGWQQRKKEPVLKIGHYVLGKTLGTGWFSFIFDALFSFAFLSRNFW